MKRITKLLITSTLLLSAACKKDADKPANTTTDDERTATVPGPDTEGTTESTTPTEKAPLTPAETKPAPAPTAPNAAMTDAQILAIGATAHEGEIDGGQLALTKSKNQAVRAFAQMMIDEHGKALGEAKALAEKLAITPEDTEMVATMKADHASAKDKLAALDGDAFDQAYTAMMVEGHQKVLDLLTQQLIPNAQNAELKTHLEGLKPAVEMHLAHAKEVEAGLKTPS